METTYNPIKAVKPRGSTLWVDVPCPSSFAWGIQDVSASDAGRTEDAQMMKMELGQCVKINLSWQNITDDVAQRVLSAFNSEYMDIEYKDPLMGKYVIKEFYTGDRQSVMYNSRLGIWSSISFSIIERKAKKWNAVTKEWPDTVTGN